MICSKCNTAGELKVFSTFSYYYCTTCKDEIKLEEVKPASPEGAQYKSCGIKRNDGTECLHCTDCGEIMGVGHWPHCRWAQRRTNTSLLPPLKGWTSVPPWRDPDSGRIRTPETDT